MSPLWKLRVRLRAIDPRTADVMLGGLFAAAAVVESLFSDSVEGHVALGAIVGALAVGPSVALRRRQPLVAAAIYIAMILGTDLFGPSIGDEVATPFIAVLVLFYSIGRYLDGRRFWVGFGFLAIGLTGVVLADSGAPGDFLYVLVLTSMPALAGRAVRSRVLLQGELRVKALRLQADREERALRAVDHERGRIAEELQSVVANGLSAMIVQAAAVPRVLDAGHTAAAEQSFLVIEETGRDALAEMRRLLGVLRRDDEAPDLAPQPGLGRLEALLERMRQAGLEVRVKVEGVAGPLPTGVDLTAYRVIQQAVEAAGAAGAGTASLTIRHGARDIEISVSDDRPAGAAAEVSAEMRERVRLYGGRVQAASSNGHGHRVNAWLPVDELAAR